MQYTETAGIWEFGGGIDRGRSPDDKTERISARKPLPGPPGPSKVLTLFRNFRFFLGFLQTISTQGGLLMTKQQELGRGSPSLGRQGPPKF